MPRKKNEALHTIRQQQILDAAKSCFVRHGFHATSMRQILDAAGISAGGAYNYFASKDDIILGLVAEERAEIEGLAERLQKQKNPLLGIAQLVHDAIAYTTGDKAILATEIYAESLRNPAVGEMEKANMEIMKEALLKAVATGLKEGVIASGHGGSGIVEWLLALIEGYIGRVARYPKLDSGSAARMAKKTVLQLLGE